MEGEKSRVVCVTGAGGFIASWLVKFLLAKGYAVRGTVRDPSSEKNAHLKKLDNASENLQLVKADLLDYDALTIAIAGCEGVFHVASPVPSSKVPNPEVEVISPAVTGTLNVLKACTEAKMKRVVVVSSVAAVVMNPSWPQDKLMDEECWSDKEYCRKTEGGTSSLFKLVKCPLCRYAGSQRRANFGGAAVNISFGRFVIQIRNEAWSLGCRKNWYCLSKTLAEADALDYAAKHGLDVVTVCPAMVLGPLLQATVNSSSLFLLNLLNGNRESVENKLLHFVDVRDVADALLLVYERPEASGRYICGPHQAKPSDLVEMLKSMYPQYSYPKNYTEVEARHEMASEKLKMLGWRCRTLKDTLVDTIKNYREAGLL